MRLWQLSLHARSRPWSNAQLDREGQVQFQMRANCAAAPPLACASAVVSGNHGHQLRGRGRAHRNARVGARRPRAERHPRRRAAPAQRQHAGNLLDRRRNPRGLAGRRSGAEPEHHGAVRLREFPRVAVWPTAMVANHFRRDARARRRSPPRWRGRLRTRGRRCTTASHRPGRRRT